MTASVITRPSAAMRADSHGGPRPQWSGGTAVPVGPMPENSGFGVRSGVKLSLYRVVLATMLRILRTLFVGLVLGLVLLPFGVMAVLVFAAGLVIAVIAGKILLFIVFPIWLVVEITRALRRPSRVYG